MSTVYDTQSVVNSVLLQTKLEVDKNSTKTHISMQIYRQLHQEE